MSEGEPKSASSLPRPLTLIRRLDESVQRIEVGVCLTSLALMILLAFVQVLLRRAQGSELLGGMFDSPPQPIGWFNNVAQHLVIWVGVLGASLATAEGRHISIEAFPKLLSDRGRRFVDVLVNAVSFGISAVLFLLCVVYLTNMIEHESAQLFVVQALDLKVPRWPFLLVVPLGLALISWRFALRGVEALVLDDATYKALREQEQARELAEVEATQEDQEVDLLLDHARRTAKESGVALKLDAETARAQVREALRSDRLDALIESGPEQDEDALAPPPPPAPTPPKATPPKRPEIKAGLRSTDEIPTYSPTDLHDDEDKADPIMQRGAPQELDSSDMLGVPEMGDVGLTSSDAEDAVEAVADTARLHDRAQSEVAPPLPPGDDPEAITQRVPVELPDSATQRVPLELPNTEIVSSETNPLPESEESASDDADADDRGGES